jgi:beta-mannanase
MAIDHVYHGWDTPFPSEYDRWTVSEGRMPFLSWSSRRDQQAPAKWADIAAGRYDDLIEQRASEVAALGVPVLMSLDHEPMSQVGTGAWDSGSVEEFRAAFRHVTEVFERAGGDNVAWVWTLIALQFRTGDPQGLYPGDDVVDWIGVDGYVNIGCPWLDVGWRSWGDVFSAAHEFALGRGKPLIVAEFGLREDPDDPGRKGEWLASSVAEIQAMPALKAVVSFNSEADCSSYVVSSPEALDGYRRMGSDPWFALLGGTAGAHRSTRL